MVNYRLIYKVLGSLLFLLGTLLFICACIALYYHEDDFLAFVISTIFASCCGFILKYMGRDADNNLGRRDSYLLVTVTWIVFSLLGMLPFLISGYISNVTDAFFETMSGFTTTGATIWNGYPMPLSIGVHRPSGLAVWESCSLPSPSCPRW